MTYVSRVRILKYGRPRAHAGGAEREREDLLGERPDDQGEEAAAVQKTRILKLVQDVTPISLAR
jgi:hypothetical protein